MRAGRCRKARPGRQEGRPPVTPELIAILAVGVGLAGLMWQSMRRMETRMETRIAEVRNELGEAKRDLGARIDGVRNELGTRIDGVKSELGEAKRELGARIDSLKGELGEAKQDLGARIDSLKGELDEAKRDLGARIDGLAEEMREMRDRLGRLEGKMDFVYDYITRRNDPAPAAE